MAHNNLPRNADGSLKFSWGTTIVFGLFHVGAIAALFFFSWTALFWTALAYWLTIGWGIGLGYHRLHTHRSYKVPKWFDYLLAMLGTKEKVESVVSDLSFAAKASQGLWIN